MAVDSRYAVEVNWEGQMKYRIQPFFVVGMILAGGRALTAADVVTVKLPESTFRPQVVIDAVGTIHLVHAHLQKRGDLFYARKEVGEDDFSAPIRVNSTPNCVASFNMAVGKDGRAHVLIRPNAKYSANKLGRKPKFRDLKYMLYCRLNDQGTQFEPERDLSGPTFGFEGVGAILADGQGAVSVYWHGLAEPGPEHTRVIFVARSADKGRSFTKPEKIQTNIVGACACCSMSGKIDPDGTTYLIYRNSEPTASKDSYLLVSDDGMSFNGTLLEPWANAGCPGSVFAIDSGPSGTFVAWDTRAEVRFAKSNTRAEDLRAVAPATEKMSRSPVLASNSRGELLVAWSEADQPGQFRQGADLAWQVFDRDGAPMSEKQVLAGGVGPRWSMPSAYAEPDDDFVILYDGTGNSAK